MWWMSGVVDVLFYPWCGGCLVWWMSGVVDVCVVDVVQSVCRRVLKCILHSKVFAIPKSAEEKAFKFLFGYSINSCVSDSLWRRSHCTICTKLGPKIVGAFPNILTSFLSSSPFLCENAQEIG